MDDFTTALVALRWVLGVGALMVLASLLSIPSVPLRNRRPGGDS